MDYNNKRKKMSLPEYGRNIQNMVDYMQTIEETQKRKDLDIINTRKNRNISK